MSNSTGIITAIYLRPDRNSAPISVEQAQAVIGLGLEGDHFSKKGGKRQITLMSKQAWETACQELGTSLDPSIRRANVVVDGLDFKESTGRQLKAGYTNIVIEGETAPCRLMDEAHPGLKDALTPDWRGGVYGKVVSPGLLQVGDKIFWSTGL